MMDKIWDVVWKVKVEKWREIPGVFLWVLLVLGPGVFGGGVESRERKVVVGLLCEGVIVGMGEGGEKDENGDEIQNNGMWDIVEDALRTWSCVQGWLGICEDGKEG